MKRTKNISTFGKFIIFLEIIIFISIFVFLIKRAAKPNKLIILGTADIQGLVEPSLNIKGENPIVGGLSRIGYIIKKIKSENNNSVLVVSTGDDLMNRFFHTFKGKAIFTLLSEAGYDYYCFGNHEFDKGANILSNATKIAKFKILCSDIVSDKANINCLKYDIINKNNIKIGLFSLITEDLPFVISDKSVHLSGKNIDIAKQMVSKLKEQGANIIIALTHIGEDADINLAKTVDGIDLIFGGHSHEYTQNPIIVNNTIIVNGGEKGDYLVRLDFLLKNKKIYYKNFKFKLIPITKNLKEDEKIKKMINIYREKFPDSIVLGKTLKPWDMRSSLIRKNESNIADLINDLLRKKFKVDIVLNNAGAFRGKKVYAAGDITDTMLHEIDEFSNYAYTLDIKGDILKKILELGAASYGRGGFLQVSGIRYTINFKNSSIIVRKTEGEWKILKEGNRVTNIEVFNNQNKQWEPLDKNRNYKILSNSFLVNKGGDRYFFFKKYGTNLKNTYSTFYSILSEFVETNKIINPPDIDGRIKIIN
jgi:5'-nucleotidase